MGSLNGPVRYGGALLFGIVLLLPLLFSPLPMLSDYPNHLARFWLLSGGAELMPDVYGVDWSRARTNIGADLVTVALKGLLPGERIAQGILAAAILGPALGCFLLSLRLHGWNAWQFALPFFAWTHTLIFGFVTFQIGLGVALVLAAADGGREGGAAVWLSRLVAAAALLVVHPFALLFYAALLGGLIIGPRLAPILASRAAFLAFLGKGAGLVLCCALPVIVFALTAKELPGADANANGDGILWNTSIAGRIAALTSPVRLYEIRTDMVLVALLAVVPIVALLRSGLRTHQGLLLVALVLAAASPFMPLAVAGTSVIQVRIPIMALLAAAAAIRIELPARAAVVAGLALALLSVARTGDVARHWARSEEDIQAMRAVLAALPRGSSILPLQHEASREAAVRSGPLGRYFTGDRPAYTQSVALAAPWRQAFVPMLFTARGKQPLVVLPPWNEIAVPEGEIATIHALIDPELPLPPSQAYVRQWRERFDYALVLNTDMEDMRGPVTLPAGVEVVAAQGFAQLLRLPRAARTAAAR